MEVAGEEEEEQAGGDLTAVEVGAGWGGEDCLQIIRLLPPPTSPIFPPAARTCPTLPNEKNRKRIMT